MKKRGLFNRILAGICVVAMVAVQAFVLVPTIGQEDAFGAQNGRDLVVRVQYFGERGDKLRVKKTFSGRDLADLWGMEGGNTYYYSNVTRVGTVMVMKARGPSVASVIEAAGIDMGSVHNITFATDDGYTRNFTAATMMETRYYYPLLSSLYERCAGEVSGDSDNGNSSLIPLTDALEGAESVPAIIAITYGESKEPGKRAENLSLNGDKPYRFCLGQTALVEGQETSASDVTSLESCHSIGGIDVTLSGAPPITEVKLNIGNEKLKVGSKKKISAKISTDDMFEENYDASDLTWTSSDESIATVDENGVVTIKKEGSVTITATAPNGVSASITINGKEEKKDNKDSKNAETADKNGGQQQKDGKKSDKKNPSKKTEAVEAKTITVKEITLGDEIVPETSMADEDRTESMADDAEELDAGDDFSPGVAGGTAAVLGAACTAGLTFRFRRYRIDK